MPSTCCAPRRWTSPSSGARARDGLLAETLDKELKACASTVVFFTAEGNIEWELAHNTGATLLAADSEKKVKQLVFIDPATEIGKEVTLKK